MNAARISLLSAVVGVAASLFALHGCTSKPTDMRTLVPAETLIYLETRDMAAALEPMFAGEAFRNGAMQRPDISALRGVQVAVAVTGFDATEVALTDEGSVGRIKPRFVAVADTHAWNYQAAAFAEKTLSRFVEEIYGSDAAPEKSAKDGTQHFVWSAADGRKAFASVNGSLVWFSNDSAALEKCLAVRRGESADLLSVKSPPAPADSLAFGFVTGEGVSQLGALFGVAAAVRISDDEEVRGAVAEALPQLIRSSVTEVRWYASRHDEGYSDRWQIGLRPQVSEVLRETLTPARNFDAGRLDRIPQSAASATAYSLNDPRIAYRSILLLIEKQLGDDVGPMIAELSKLFFEPYGIAAPEEFLRISTNIVTANDATGERPTVSANAAEARTAESFLDKDLKGGERPNFLLDADRETAAWLDGATLASGDAAAVTEIADGRFATPAFGRAALAREALQRNAIVVTVGREPAELPAYFSPPADLFTTYLTESRLVNGVLERTTYSDFGLLGSLAAALSDE